MDDPSDASSPDEQDAIIALARAMRDRGTDIWRLQRTQINATSPEVKRLCLQEIADIQAALDVAMTGNGATVWLTHESQLKGVPAPAKTPIRAVSVAPFHALEIHSGRR